MSRKVSKIFVICALVAIVPLMVVGSTLAAVYSMDSTVFVEAVIDQDIAESAKTDANFAHVACNDVSKDSFKIVAGRNQSAEVRADYAPNAYVFKGWFQGSKQQYEAAKEAGEVEFVSTDAVFTFDVKAVANVVAVYDAVKYDNVTYQYKQNPTDANNVVVAPNGKTSFVYGEELPVLETETEGYTYGGWKVWSEASVDGNANVGYKYATFDLKYATNPELYAEGEGPQSLCLTDPWLKGDIVVISYYDLGRQLVDQDTVERNSAYTISAVEEVVSNLQEGYTYYWTDVEGNKIENYNITAEADLDLYLARSENKVSYTVTYYDFDGQVITTATVDKNTYLALDTVENVLKAAGKENLLAKGYVYSWVDAKGAPISGLTVTDNANIYLHKELISYNAVLLASDEGTFNGSEDITFNVESDAQTLFAQWLDAQNWTMKYSFWKFNGIKLGGTVYNADNISTFVADYIANHDNTEAAEFELNTQKYFTTVSVNAQITAKARVNKTSRTFSNDVYTNFGYTNDNPLKLSRVNGLESAATLNSFLGIDSQKLYTKINNNKTEVELIELVIYSESGERLPVGNLSRFATMNDLIESLLETKQIELGEVFTISGLEMHFQPVV